MKDLVRIGEADAPSVAIGDVVPQESRQFWQVAGAID